MPNGLRNEEYLTMKRSMNNVPDEIRPEIEQDISDFETYFNKEVKEFQKEQESNLEGGQFDQVLETVENLTKQSNVGQRKKILDSINVKAKASIEKINEQIESLTDDRSVKSLTETLEEIQKFN